MVDGQLANENLICERADNVDTLESRARGGPPVLKGPKGELGGIGPPGAPGHIDSSIVNTTIKDKVNTVLDKLVDNVERLYGRLKMFQSHVDRLANVVVEPAIAPPSNAPAICKVWFKERCYWAKVFDDRKIVHAKAKHICNRDSGYLANLYNAQEYTSITRYLRGLIPTRMEYIEVHVGMTARPQSETIVLRNGSTATFVPWYHGSVNFNLANTAMELTVQRDESSALQGIQVYPFHRAHGVLCEI